jgi:hypothetical protein
MSRKTDSILKENPFIKAWGLYIRTVISGPGVLSSSEILVISKIQRPEIYKQLLNFVQ